MNFTKTTSVKKFLSVFAIITALFFGSMGAANASPASPVVAHSVTTVAEESVTPMAGVWVAYDYAVITSAGNCDARLKWLRANVSWVNTTNSMCQKFVRNQCPVSYYWMVMVKDQSAGLLSLKSAEPVTQAVLATCA